MKKELTALLVILLVGCSVTMIGVRNSDRTIISTEANRDSITIGGGELNWDLNRSANDSIKINDTLK